MSDVVLHVLHVEHLFNVGVFIMLEEYLGYCVRDGRAHCRTFVCVVYFVLEHEVVLC